MFIYRYVYIYIYIYIYIRVNPNPRYTLHLSSSCFLFRRCSVSRARLMWRNFSPSSLPPTLTCFVDFVFLFLFCRMVLLLSCCCVCGLFL